MLKKIEIVLRNLTGGIVFFILLIFGIFLLLLTYITKEKRIIGEYARYSIRILVFIFGLKVRIYGEENLKSLKGKFIIVGNHQSYLDPIVLYSYLKGVPRFFVRHDVFSLPIIGHGLKVVGFIPVVRKHPKKAKEAIYKAIEYIDRSKSEAPLVIFPEGTRTRNGKLNRFKKGAFIISKEKDLPLLPVAFSGFFEAMPRGKFYIKPMEVKIKYLKPIYPEEFKDKSINDYKEFVKQMISKEIELRG